MLELPAPKIGTEEFNKCIRRAIGQMQGHKERWQKLIDNGATDEQIKKQLGYEMGDYGSCGPNIVTVETKGGVNPRIWLGMMNTYNKPPTIGGAHLVNYVRSLLQIPYPHQVRQPRLF